VGGRYVEWIGSGSKIVGRGDIEIQIFIRFNIIYVKMWVDAREGL